MVIIPFHSCPQQDVFRLVLFRFVNITPLLCKLITGQSSVIGEFFRPFCSTLVTSTQKLEATRLLLHSYTFYTWSTNTSTIRLVLHAFTLSYYQCILRICNEFYLCNQVMTYFSYDNDHSERQHLKQTKLTIPYNSLVSLSYTFYSHLQQHQRTHHLRVRVERPGKFHKR